MIPATQWNLVKEKYNEAADSLIDVFFGKPCKLYYGTTKSVCTNCNYNPITHTSSNTYKSGGPIPFDGTICPFCDGEGFTYLESTETIKLRIYPSRKNWIKLDIPFSVKDGAIQTIGHLADLPKCKSAKYVTMNTDVAGMINCNYVLAGEPTPHGLGDKKYFIAFWNMYNG